MLKVGLFLALVCARAEGGDFRMLKLTDLISKPVVSLAEGRLVGTAQNAVFDKKLKKMQYLAAFDENGGEDVFIPASSVVACENHAVIVKCVPAPRTKEISVNSPLKARVFLHDGSSAGAVGDIVLNDDFTVSHIERDNGGDVAPEQVVGFSAEAAVVCFDEEKLKQLKRLRPPKPAEENAGERGEAETPARNAGDERGEERTPAVSDEAGEQGERGENAPEIPQRGAEENKPEIAVRNIVTKFNYLIGRRVTADVYFHNIPLIRGYSVVTAAHIDICRKYGRLIELAKNTKPIA
jgi:sporulation protein YlmC with PRC-barrel domain